MEETRNQEEEETGERKGGQYLVNNEELLAVHIHLKDDTAHLSGERRLRPRSHEHLSFKATWRRWREKGCDDGDGRMQRWGVGDDAAPTQKAQAAKRLDAQAHLLRAVNGWLAGSEGPGEVGGS